jgi:hypothetical protein
MGVLSELRSHSSSKAKKSSKAVVSVCVIAGQLGCVLPVAGGPRGPASLASAMLIIELGCLLKA